MRPGSSGLCEVVLWCCVGRGWMGSSHVCIVVQIPVFAYQKRDTDMTRVNIDPSVGHGWLIISLAHPFTIGALRMISAVNLSITSEHVSHEAVGAHCWVMGSVPAAHSSRIVVRVCVFLPRSSWSLQSIPRASGAHWEWAGGQVLALGEPAVVPDVRLVSIIYRNDID